MEGLKAGQPQICRLQFFPENFYDDGPSLRYQM